MLKRASWIVTIAVSMLPAVAIPAQKRSVDYPDAPTFVVPERGTQQELRILVYGDMRFTDPANTSDTDPRARQWLAQKVGTEQTDAMIITGDIPFRGGDQRDWDVFESECASWAKRPRVYPTIGNHELLGHARRGQENFFAAFPQLEGNGFYSVLLENVFIITLNSTEPIWPVGQQADWLRGQLDHIPQQADFVIFSMHIPLIADTQSEFIANIPAPESVALRRYLEARAVSSRQKFIVVNGHIHNYERFEFNEITHIISGGGGAAPYPVLIRGPQDLYRDPAFPVFNYVILTIHGKHLEGTMYKIANPDAKEYSVVAKDQFSEMAK